MIPVVRTIYPYLCLLHWILILVSISLSHGLRFRFVRSKPACFELTQNTEDGGYNWDKVPPQMKIPLSCTDAVLSKVIALESVTHSIPVNESNHCPPNNCPEDHHTCNPLSCCYAKDIMKCEEEITISERQRNECNGKTECELLVNRQGLGSVCRRHIDYNCIDNTTKPEIRKCKTRWVTVGYNCIQGNKYPFSTELMTSSTESSSLIIGLAVTVCALFLFLSLITVIFGLRYRQLKAQCTRGHRVVSTYETNHETDLHNDVSLYNELDLTYESGLREQPGIGDGQYLTTGSRATSSGLSTPLPQKPKERKVRKSSYDNVTEVSDDEECTKVDRDLKQNSIPKDIDASYIRHDPDKQTTPRMDARYINIRAAGVLNL